ncbi:putative amidoligase enzyme-domain-containing protein [Rhypophila decipiens]|uniref:Amidoligase enzyme-domain-containing protein n=1 Tax=Rhypophila decipiens TaxID=261697 RepID=A0AAN7B791_9PEZI|nr:putative amidoligase enzyme-domain-containing protein [Rhypophila decipiens]
MAGPTPQYSLGVEIEMVSKPHKIRDNLGEKHALYYGKLAKALRNRGLQAAHNDLTQQRWRSTDYNKWYITKDGSLGHHRDNFIPMEAVSPVLNTAKDWDKEIDTFWEAARAVFHMPERHEKCGSHVHVSRGKYQQFTLDELKTIGYGIVIYENLVFHLLMPYRQENPYCQGNSVSSVQLQNCRGNHIAIANTIRAATSPDQLRNVMQTSRYVLWNFDNVATGQSGTIEFRGGRFLRGEVRTKRWMTFAVAFIHAMLRINDLATSGVSIPDIDALYSEIKKAARQLRMKRFLPDQYQVLNETLPST